MLGGQPSRLLSNAQGFTWIHTGSGPARVLFSEWTADAPRMELLTSMESRAGVRRVYLPEDVYGMVHRANISPDRQWVLLVEMGMSGWMPCRLISFDARSHGKLVGPPAGQCTNAAWSPDGKSMYFSANIGRGFHVWRQRFPDGEPEQLTSGAAEEEGLAIAPDGRSLVTSVGTSQSTLWVHDARGERQITSQGFPAASSFSADGRRLYYLSLQGSSTSLNMIIGDLWAVDLETGQRERLLHDFRMEHYSVSQDGKRVVFVRRDVAGASPVWLATLDGSTAPRTLTSLNAVTSFFGAGGDIFFLGWEGTATFLYRVREDGSGLQKIVPEPVKFLYDVSPDGKWLAAWVERGVVVYPAAGGPRTVVCQACGNRPPPDQPHVVSWSRNGKYVYLHEGQARQTYAVPLKPGQPLPPLPPSGISSPAAATGLPGARLIPEQRAFGGANPSVYAFSRVTTHRNIYRIPVP